jgi:hypothetical protein
VDVRHCTPTNQSKEELMFALSLKDARNFRQRYLLPAISNNLIEMTQADKPNSPTQKTDILWRTFQRRPQPCLMVNGSVVSEITEI